MSSPSTGDIPFRQEEKYYSKDCWREELKYLAIEPRRQNELNDKGKLGALAESMKTVYYRGYKTVYGSGHQGNEIKKSS
jgi:hypothetical protein